jgi:hypothetical protein
MGFRAHCNWCGEYINLGGDHAELCVTIQRKRATKLESRFAQQVRPTLHFCVTPNGDNDRMGIDEDASDPDSCYERAMAMIEGRETAEPNMGMEWRLVPVGGESHEPTRRAQKGDPTPEPVPVRADADLEAFLSTLSSSGGSTLNGGSGNRGSRRWSSLKR